MTKTRLVSSQTFTFPTTVFLLTALFSAVESTSAESTNQKSVTEFKPNFVCKSKKGSFTTVPMLPASHYDIAKFIEGSRKDCGWVAEFIENMRQLNFYMKTYFDLVFTDVEKFKIKIHSEEDEMEIIANNAGQNSARGFNAFFSIKTNVIHLKNFFSIQPFEMMDIMRHEFRHAAMSAAQKLLQSSSERRQSHCHFPSASSKERERVQAMVDAGYKRAAALPELLRKEIKKTLPISEQEKLNELRIDCLEEYQKYYRHSFSVAILISDLEKIGIKRGREFSSGQFVNLDKFLISTYGNIIIKNVSSHKDELKVIVDAEFLDPIACAANKVIETIDHVKENYHEDLQLYEIDAYLTGSFPQAIIKYLFPEFHQYTNDLLKRALMIRELKSNKTKENLAYGTLTTSIGHYQAADADNMIPYALYAISKGKLDEAEAGLTTLISKGRHKDVANLYLARIAYQKGNLNASCRFYKRAHKQQAFFERDDFLDYATCIEPTEPETAKHYRKIANKIR